MSSSNASSQDLEVDSKMTTMLPSDAPSQNPTSDTAIATTSSSNASIIGQLQSDLAEIDRRLKGFAAREERLDGTLEEILVEALKQARVDKEKQLVAVMMEQLQADFAEIDRQVKELAAHGEQPNEALKQAKIDKEKQLVAVIIQQLQFNVAEMDKQLEEFAVHGEHPNEAPNPSKVNKEKQLIATMMKQLQADLAEIDRQLKGFAVRRERPDQAFVQLKIDKERQLIAVMIIQLQSNVAEVNRQLQAFFVRGERPSNALIQAKVTKEKHLYTLKQKKELQEKEAIQAKFNKEKHLYTFEQLQELQENEKASIENTVSATKALVGYLPTPDKLVSRATIKRRNGRAYAKNEVFVYQTYRYDTYTNPPDKEVKYRHVKDEQVTVPCPIDLPHYFPQEGHELTDVDRQKFDAEHTAGGSWLGFEDFEPHGYLKQAGGLDIPSLVAITQGQG